MEDFMPEYITKIEGLTIEIEKVGGGTLGKEYEGTWRYRITNTETGEVVSEGSDYHTGRPHKHTWVAVDLAESL